MHARGEPFDSPLILSLSKDERLAQDRLVEPRASWWLVLRQAQDERGANFPPALRSARLQACRERPGTLKGRPTMRISRRQVANFPPALRRARLQACRERPG